MKQMVDFFCFAVVEWWSTELIAYQNSTNGHFTNLEFEILDSKKINLELF